MKPRTIPFTTQIRLGDYLGACEVAYNNCDGRRVWDNGGRFGHRQPGHSALDACCACGGNAAKHPDFEEVERRILDAPTNGVETLVTIDKPTVEWAVQVVIESGQNIAIVSTYSGGSVLDAGSSTRHLWVKVGGTLSVKGITFKKASLLPEVPFQRRRNYVVGEYVFLTTLLSTRRRRCFMG